MGMFQCSVTRSASKALCTVESEQQDQERMTGGSLRKSKATTNCTKSRCTSIQCSVILRTAHTAYWRMCMCVHACAHASECAVKIQDTRHSVHPSKHRNSLIPWWRLMAELSDPPPPLPLHPPKRCNFYFFISVIYTAFWFANEHSDP